jgi:hypothetical protein
MDASSEVGRPAAHPGRSPKLCPHLEPAAQLIEVHIYTEGMMDPKQNQTEIPFGCCVDIEMVVETFAWESECEL